MRLEARDLAFGHPGRTLGRNVSFSLGAGEALAVLGPNGGGKTTLFRTVLGLLPAHGGELLLDERPVRNWRPAQPGAFPRLCPAGSTQASSISRCAKWF